jgi:cytochrome c553
VWLPSFLVQAALFGHVLVFRRLRAHAKGTALVLMVALIGSAAVKADADARAGEEKAQLCLLCHKPNNPAIHVPTLEGQTREYLYNQIMAYRDKRRPDLYMQTNVASLSDEDIRDIAAYFASRPPVRASFVLDADAIARGRSAAGRLGCGTCHKPGFSGDGEVPRLAGLEPRYARLQLLDLAAGKRPHPRVNGLSGLAPEDAEGLAQFFAHLE